MNFGEVLRRSWDIIWKYKVLWIFGILAGLANGGGGGSGSSGGGSRNVPSGDNGNNFGNLPFSEFERFSRQAVDFFENIPIWVYIALAVGFVVLFLVLIFLGTIGRIGLAKGAWKADEGVEALSFSGLFSESMGYFWRVFLLSLLIGFLSMVVVVVLILLGIGVGVATLGIGLLCLLPFFCLMIPVFWLVSVVLEQAVVAIVGEDMGMIAGLQKGWDTFRMHLGEMVVMALILLVGGGVVKLLIGLPAILIVLPLLATLFTMQGQIILGGAAVSLVLLCVYIPVAVILNGILQSYLGTAWVLTYRRLNGRAASALSEAASEIPSEPTPPVESGSSA
jgi:hypothetical protein